MRSVRISLGIGALLVFGVVFISMINTPTMVAQDICLSSENECLYLPIFGQNFTSGEPTAVVTPVAVVSTPTAVAMGESGGTFTGESGLVISVDADVFEEDVTLQVADVIREPAQSEEVSYEAASRAYEVSMPEDTALNGVVELTLPLSQTVDVDDELLTVLRWDGTYWWDSGGIVAGDVISTTTDQFSIFQTAYLPTSLRRRVAFANFGTHNASVRTYTYTPPSPSQFYYTPNVAVAAFKFGSPGLDHRGYMGLPLGMHSFCVQWKEGEDEDEDGYVDVYRWFTGNYYVGEHLSDIVPLQVRFQAGRTLLPSFERGLCPLATMPLPQPTRWTSGITFSGDWTETVVDGAVSSFETSAYFNADFDEGVIQGRLTGIADDPANSNVVCNGNPVTAAVQTFYSIEFSGELDEEGNFSASIAPSGTAYIRSGACTGVAFDYFGSGTIRGVVNQTTNEVSLTTNWQAGSAVADGAWTGTGTPQ